jgi:hypothetical protein
MIRAVSRFGYSQQVAMAGVIEEGLYGPTGMYWRVPAKAQALMDACPLDVMAQPSRGDIEALQRAGTPVGRGDRLLGLYTRVGSPDDPVHHIQVYGGPVGEVDEDPVMVAYHEYGHLIYDDPDHQGVRFETAFGVIISETEMETRLRASGQLGAEHAPGCGGPTCQLEGELARSMAALDGLRQRAHMQHKIPLGLGGRIPETRDRLEVARSWLSQAGALMPDRQGQVRSIERLISASQEALTGEELGPDDVGRAYAAVYRAWDASYDFAHAYQLRTRYGIG